MVRRIVFIVLPPGESSVRSSVAGNLQHRAASLIFPDDAFQSPNPGRPAAIRLENGKRRFYAATRRTEMSKRKPTRAPTMYGELGLFINGEWQPARSGRTYPVTNPATEEPLGEAPSAGAADTEAAIAAAARGLEVWRRTQPLHRARGIREIRELMHEPDHQLARSLAVEVGNPL